MSFIETIYLPFPQGARYLIIPPNYLQPIMAVPNNPVSRYGSLLNGKSWSGASEENSALAETCLQSFVKKMNDELETEFMKNQRIRALLTMLQWPGPAREWTRYMEIEHSDPKEKRGKRNEYKERPVLPTPFGVWSKHKA